MSDLQLRARSTTEIVDAAVQLYRRDPLRYMLLTALAYAPWVVLQLVVLGSASASEPPTGVLGVFLYTGMFLSFAVMSAVLARLAASAYLGEPREMDDAIRDVLPRVPAVVGATLLKYLLFALGLLVFLVGGLYVMTRYFATTQAVVLEGTGARRALSRSTALSKGLKRHVFNTMALVWIIYLAISMAATMLAAPGGDIVVTVVSTLITVVAYPVVGLVEVLLYYDARVRQEGYDIELMAGSLDGSAAPVV